MRPLAWLLIALLALPLASAYTLAPRGWSATGKLVDGCDGTLDASALGPAKGEWLFTLDVRPDADCDDALSHQAWVRWDPRWDSTHALYLDDASAAFVGFATDASGARTLLLHLWDAERGDRTLAGALHETELG